MESLSATATAHPNIALIKYWGNRHQELRLPANGSISFNLGELFTRTRVDFTENLEQDCLTINQHLISGPPLERVSQFLNTIRELGGSHLKARVTSYNNFPIGAGIASSAAAFAALALAGSHALQINLLEASLSALARRGSGSACRSIPGGFVEWQVGEDDSSSFAATIAGPEHWDLVDCIAIVESGPKAVGSTEGHASANSSILQSARLTDTPRRLEICRNAILHQDFLALAEVVELDSNLMHAIMQTSRPPLFYWSPASLELMQAIPRMRQSGLPVCYTLDAGPNVHAICLAEAAPLVETHLSSFPGVERVITSPVGGPAILETNNE